MEGENSIMGSRGSFLESGGFRTPAKWHTVDYVEGVKVLRPKDGKASLSLPERSNTPGTSYVLYGKDGTFKQFISFDKNRLPLYRIDFGTHQGKKSLHVHFFKNGNKEGRPDFLHPGDKLYEKHKRLFRGVK
jgi:hypothetical protein